jgi:hypothetical protein
MKHPAPTFYALLATLLLGASAHAQYAWIDDKGVKQFSDRPPPASVPYQRILKAPGKPDFDPNAPAPDEAAAAPATRPRAAPTLREREADYNKRRADAALADRKAADDAARRADLAAACVATRNNQRMLDQGGRISNIDANGERAIMDDAQRAAASARNKKALANCQ